MKKIKILFCGLLIGLSVLSYLVANQKSFASELLRSNVDALTFDESTSPNCVYASGFCTTNSGGIIRGMKYVE